MHAGSFGYCVNVQYNIRIGRTLPRRPMAGRSRKHHASNCKFKGRFICQPGSDL
ncbi:hypothetical protein BN2497_425 [Janthinobacterium sp. CG23_2]|nr:hypothetical protein BN2497_425 [Janthinobacterium sp. CG23_2]CUU26610.1 hypothetical protein BN3177_425 [Janthinobacterium sp. CG23_2]